MRRRSLILGAALGLTAAGLVLALLPSASPAPVGPRGRALSDCAGPLGELVIQYRREAADLSAPVYASLLTQLPGETIVHVVCPGRADVQDLVRRVGPVACRLEPILVGHEMTTWSRDRWLALGDGDRTSLLFAWSEDGEGVWPQRRGDSLIAFDVARARNGVSAHRSRLRFDGGDFVVTETVAFVTPRMVRANVERGLGSRDRILAELSELLDRRVIALDEAPDHHMGIYLMAAGDGRVLVADPSLAADMLPEDPASTMPCGIDQSLALQAKLDAVALQVRAAGFEVVRMPVLAGLDGRTWMTPLNAILETGEGGRAVYMPVYAGAEALNVAAEEIWRDLGFSVHRVDCTSAYRHFGSLRCLVNVLDRD